MTRAGLCCAALLAVVSSAGAQHAPHRVTGGDWNAVDPAVSPDGRELAYACDRSGAFRIFIYDLERCGARRITQGPGDDRRPCWSPDGDRILYTCDGKLFEVDADGAFPPRPLTDGRDHVVSGSYGPKGRALLLVRRANRNPTETRTEIALLRLTTSDGVAERALGDGAAARFSPHGRSILFVSHSGGGGRICAMGADGAQQRTLASGVGGRTDPCFSPDGARIAFASDQTGNFEIYVMDKDARRVRQLTSHPAADTQPCWGVDGSIYFTRRPQGGKAEIHRVDAPRD